MLDRRHPAHEELLAVLDDLTGVRRRHEPTYDSLLEPELDTKRALGHDFISAFEVLHLVATVGLTLDREAIGLRRLRHLAKETIDGALDALVTGGVIDEGEDGIRFSSDVPARYIALIEKIGTHIGLDVPDDAGSRAWAYKNAPDGAPRLFGTDVRMRNLMALAVHGPLHYRTLALVTGQSHVKIGRDNAPVGRSDVVRIWNDDKGTAMALDPEHPLALPLRRLLLALEKQYPVRRMERPEPAPVMPEPRGYWRGDRLALFGSAIPTKILLTLGNRGWTYEAICCERASSSRDKNSNKRVVTKKPLHRLENEGLLSSSRRRGSGFGPRLLRISDDFPAKDELQALIDAALVAWPDLAERIDAEFNAIPAKTKEYFRRRGLWEMGA
jgi:hypothetical protein